MITVECKCGWRGDQAKLVHDAETDEKHCPLCHAIFVPFTAAARRDATFAYEAQRRFAEYEQRYADQKEIDERTWLRVWSGQQWGDEAPNRLFGSWINKHGEAV